tara:strand:+ start:75 stop:476 length:402 start_codon:yes stop_codon:yes gene_type:complete
MGYIQTTLIGNVDAEPKLFTTEKGYQILTIRVKVESRKKAKGTFQDFKSWHTVKVFGDRCAELSTLSVGDLILVKGEPRRNKWTNKEGQEQISWEIAADYAEALQTGAAPVSLGRENGTPSAAAADEFDDMPF